MEARAIHHLGVAVDDLDEALSTYERLLGARLEQRETVEDQGVEAASVRVGESRVDDLSASLEELAGLGAELIDQQPRRGLFGLEVAFVHPDSVHGVLAELVSDG
jgi:methylmalonyl-CoA/ethylmalonyl-CoA epimerase